MVSTGHIKQSFSAALPIMLGYVAIGLPAGILASSIGLSWWQALVMSVLFYSGAGQFMIPNMFLAGVPLASIIASVSFVNMRQMLYSASLAPYCAGDSKLKAFLFAACVTDESYGVNIERFREGEWDVNRALMVNMFSCTSWSLSNAAGALLGNAVGVPLAIASFAMTSIFICLLVTQKWNRGSAVAAAGAGVGVFVCKLVGLTGPAILLGAAFGVVLSLLVDKLAGKPGSPDDPSAAKGPDGSDGVDGPGGSCDSDASGKAGEAA